DSLNKTAAGARIADARDQRRLLMMLRIFGETGCKDLCKRLLRLTCEYQDKPGTIRLRDTWVEYDPRNWSPDMGVTVNVGLGTGDKSQTIQFLNMMGAYFQQAAPLGVVTPENVYQLGKMLLKAGNIQGADRLLTDPATNPPQPPQETPEQVLAKMELELEDKRQQGKARDAEYKRETDLAELEASTKLKLIDLQLKEKEVRIKEIELGLKNTELQMRMAEAGTAQVDGSMPNAMQLIVDLHRKLEELASAETHIVRGPDGKASHTVKVLPQQQYEG
ncbi:portal protein, partial [Amycolatopsis australiensis]